MASFVNELRQKYRAAGQEHVFKFLDENKLSAIESETFLKQLSSIDLDRVAKLFKTTVLDAKPSEKADVITAVPTSEIASAESPQELKDSWAKLGKDAIAAGQVAAVVLSGGQGSRLGFSGPKGMYDIKLPSHKSLFQLNAERILKLGQSCGNVIPLYIMTSPMNHDVTCEYFESNDYFGLSKENVKFFPQGTLPCLTKEGKIMLESKCKVATAPDGNGGIYPSMKQQGVIDDMEKRGIKYIHVWAIDNALVQSADPVFVGYCIDKAADVGNKACPKKSWDEKVGVMGLKNGKYHIVEYSEISEDMAKATDDATGRLLYGAGNICNHFYTLEFLRDVAIPSSSDSYHIANKKIPCADPETGETVKPTENNGIKLETFIFDVFPFSKNMGILECKREEEFSPVKNAPGSASDSPDTALAMTNELHRSWLSQAKIIVKGPAEATCEISPLVSVSGEGLNAGFKVGTELEAPLHIVSASETKYVDQNDGINVYVV